MVITWTLMWELVLATPSSRSTQSTPPLATMHGEQQRYLVHSRRPLFQRSRQSCRKSDLDDAVSLSMHASCTSHSGRSVRRGQRSKSPFVLYFANVAEFGQKAMHWANFLLAQAWFVVESHWDPLADRLGKQKLKSLASQWSVTIGRPAPSLTSSSGCYGGTIAGVHNDLESQLIAGYKRLAGASVAADAWEASPMVVGTQVAMSGIDILIFGTYHRGGIDVQVLSDVSKATANGRVPFIMYGDLTPSPTS